MKVIRVIAGLGTKMDNIKRVAERSSQQSSQRETPEII